MILKINNSFLELSSEIEIERQAKLFEDISTVSGDYSYSFSCPNTSVNREILNIGNLNSIPFWKTRITSEILNNDGVNLYSGFVQIETMTDTEISLSFFSGNTDWINLMSDTVQDLNFVKLSRLWTSDNITSSWSDNEGIVFPLVNRGALLDRKSTVYYRDDFQPFVYVKDAVKAICANYGIKFSGLEKDPVFNSMITTNNSDKGIQRRIDQNKIKAAKTSTQAISDITETAIIFDSTSLPFFNSPNNNWNSDTYTFTEDVLNVSISVNVKFTNTTFIGVSIRIYVDSTLAHQVSQVYVPAGTNTISFNVDRFEFNEANFDAGFTAGQEIQVRIYRDAFLGGSLSVISGSQLEIFPTKFYTVEAGQLLPYIKASEFIKNAVSPLNVICSYNSQSKTLTVKKLDDVVKETPIDISEYVVSTSVEFEEFISSYNQRNLLEYDTQSFEEVEEYNLRNEIVYGSGAIDVDNEFLGDEGSILDTGFTAAWQQNVPFLNSLPRLEFVEAVETSETRSVTSVTDNGGTARFNFSGGALNGGLVRVKDSTITEYNGDYEILVNTASYVEFENIGFLGDATCTIVELSLEDQDDDTQILLLNAPSTNLSEIGASTIEGPDGSDYTQAAVAYFQYPLGNLFGNNNRNSLAFSQVEEGQNSLIRSHWQSASKILNNGAMVRYEAFLPEKVFRQIDFLRPVKVIDSNGVNLYLVNRITGYKGSSMACELELVKMG